MKTIPQITSAEPRIRMPAWRSASPKKWNTRPLKMSPKDWPQKRMMSPSRRSSRVGTASQPIAGARCVPRVAGLAAIYRITRISGWVASKRLREHVVEGPDPREGDHDRLVHGSTDAGRAAGGGHALVAAHDRDDRAEDRGLHDRAPEVGDRGVGEEGGPEARQVLVVDQLRQHAAEDPEDQRVDVEQAGDQHQRQEAGHDQVLDGVDAQAPAARPAPRGSCARRGRR